MSEVVATPSAPAEQAPATEHSAESAVSATSQQPVATDKIKVKIDGKEMSITPSVLKSIAAELGTTEDDFIKNYGTQASATRKSQEIAKLRREIDSEKGEIQNMFNDLKGDPEKLWDMMKQLGHDPDKAAEDRVWKRIQYEKMSPEARLAMTEKQRADLAEQRLKDIEAENASKLSKAEASAAEEEIESDVMKVLELSKRKAEPSLIRRVAEIYESYMLAHKTKPTHEFVVKRLRDVRRQEFNEDLESTDIEELMNTLPKGFITKLQSHLVSKARSSSLPSHSPSTNASSPGKAKTERQTIDQFFKNL